MGKAFIRRWSTVIVIIWTRWMHGSIRISSRSTLSKTFFKIFYNFVFFLSSIDRMLLPSSSIHVLIKPLRYRYPFVIVCIRNYNSDIFWLWFHISSSLPSSKSSELCLRSLAYKILLNWWISPRLRFSSLMFLVCFCYSCYYFQFFHSLPFVFHSLMFMSLMLFYISSHHLLLEEKETLLSLIQYVIFFKLFLWVFFSSYFRTNLIEMLGLVLALYLRVFSSVYHRYMLY